MSPWKTATHEPIEQLGPQIWRVLDKSGNLPRQMTVARADDQSVFVHSAVCTDEETTRFIENLGPLRVVCVPSGWHRMDAPAYRARYPDAVLVGPRGARAKIEAKVALSATYDAFTPPPGLSVEHVAGSRDLEGIWQFRTGDEVTLVANDLIFNLPKSAGLIPRLMGSSGGPKITPLGKFSLVKDKPALAKQLLRLADIEGLVRIVPGHGDIITHEPAAVLRRIAGAL